MGALLLLGTACAPKVEARVDAGAEARTIPYGANAAAGARFVHDGVTLYYETYGAGQPLLLVHGYGFSIGSLAAQIAFFKQHYRVIAMDSRDHGRSSDSDELPPHNRITVVTNAAFVIRPATAADAPALAAPGERTFRNTFAAANTPEDLAAYLSTTCSAARQADELAEPLRTTLAGATRCG